MLRQRFSHKFLEIILWIICVFVLGFVEGSTRNWHAITEVGDRAPFRSVEWQHEQDELDKHNYEYSLETVEVTENLIVSYIYQRESTMAFGNAYRVDRWLSSSCPVPDGLKPVLRK